MAIAAVEEVFPVRRSTPKSVQVAAAVVGNALEWYDFTIFGFLTVIIFKLFFPTDSQYASLLLTTATFGAGFLMRPLGGILLGVYTDRKGRKAALQFIIGLMTVAIAIITFAPTYAAIGVVAPLSILLARLLQGLATGGEWGCSTAFLIESAPTGQRGFYGSWQMASQGLALLAGALVSFFVTRIFTPEAFLSWGWRIPFLMGLFIGPVGIFIRRYLNETDAFLELPLDKQENQFAKTVATHFKELLVCIGLYSGGTISFYVILLYMPTFATTQLHLSLSKALVAQSVGLACMASLVPLFGALSDRVGRKPILIGAFLPYLGLAYPLFAWVHAHPTFANLLIMQVVLCSFLGAFYGPMAERGGVAARRAGATARADAAHRDASARSRR
jgi:MFS family permease